MTDEGLNLCAIPEKSIRINCVEFYAFCELKDGRLLAEVRESVYVDAAHATLLLI